jgi:putative CocE/NonD family hydrolase
VAAVIGVVAVLCLVGLPGAPRAEAATAPVTTWGYIRMNDGVLLRYTLMRPSALGRYPVAMEYGPYSEGSDPEGRSVQADRFLSHGYAVLGVNIRGTGCSSGTFAFAKPRESIDGAAVVEWAGTQPWSTGRVGMFGLSYPGIAQWGVAGLRPSHLAAISPFQSVIDAYRGAGHPGGVANAGLIAAYGLGVQDAYGEKGAVLGAGQGDRTCAKALAEHAADTSRYEVARDFLMHPFDDGIYRLRDPEQYLRNIHVPVLECESWQDEYVGSDAYRAVDQLDRSTTWAVFTNGYHGVCNATNVWPHLLGFFDHFVKGASNGFEHSPHVTVLHDAHTTLARSAKLTAGTGWPSSASWTSTFGSWPVPVLATALHLDSQGRLGTGVPRGSGRDAFVTPLPSAVTEDGDAGELHAAWKAHDAPGGSVTYTTPRLAHDAEFFGPGSAELWLTSTTKDATLQITLSEIRPDRKEVYVERGWLRASHRKLDLARSTQLNPYQTHAAGDFQPLVRNQPTLVKVELWPFNYVFRAGSAIRLTIDTPTWNGIWGFAPSPTPSVTTILHDGGHDSQLVLGLVPGGRAGAAAPACDTLLNQPCRANTAPVPAGRIDIR